MIDLHTHTFFSDGALIPSEQARRGGAANYKAIALTDHGDETNLEIIIPPIRKVVGGLSRAYGLTVLAGIELTHVPPEHMARATEKARELGAQIVLCHGETISEPVAPGTNRAAIKARVDILAHPGLISEEDVKLAAEKGVHLEITTRRGHSLTNGHVVQMVRRFGGKMVVNTDMHAPGDMCTLEMIRNVALGAGMTEEEFEQCRENSSRIVAATKKAKPAAITDEGDC